jgi:hypothetical protein
MTPRRIVGRFANQSSAEWKEKTRKNSAWDKMEIKPTLKDSHEIWNALRGLFSRYYITALYILLVFTFGRWKTWFRHPNLCRGLSILIPRMEAQSWPSLVLTLASSLVIQGNQRDTAYKHVTRLKSSDCTSTALTCFIVFALFQFRTDKAVLAVNGFAADGSMFVKKVRQRLEVCIFHDLHIPIIHMFDYY